VQDTARNPVWSGGLSAPLAGVIPMTARPAAVAVIKTVHTLLFAAIAAAVVLIAWDGARGRPAHRTLLAVGIAVGESAVYVSNGQVCPLTPLARELGATRGSVSDIFLPAWFARRLPIIASSTLVIGLLLNLRALLWPTRHSRRMG
jgi:hypothetical protein